MQQARSSVNLQPEQSSDYDARRALYRRMITVYGRKPVLEALGDPALDCRTLHLATSNRGGGIITELRRAASARGVELREHSREALARISRNGRQDQGVALDIGCPAMRELGDYLAQPLREPARLLALDGVTNPQNMGMVLRSACAAGCSGILYADRGNPALGPLVIKASAGAVFRAPLLRCSDIPGAVSACLAQGFRLYRLQAQGDGTLFDCDFAPRALFVLGGESSGLSDSICNMPGVDLAIPMAHGVESLNVAVTAALVAYAAAGHFDR
jgi:23S rRNA (guanosine2251-2'-O)-methyltransferase